MNGNYCFTRVLWYAKMVKETEILETKLFCDIFIIGGISIGGGPGPPAPGFAYDCNFNAICDIKILCTFFACLPLCVCQRDTYGSILYDHAKYVILLVKVKIVLNSSCNLNLQRTRFQLFYKF